MALALLLLAVGAAGDDRVSRAARVGARLRRASPLARAFAGEAAARAGATAAFAATLTRGGACARPGDGNGTLWVVYHGAAGRAGCAAGHCVRVAGGGAAGQCDLDVGAFTRALGPDAFYQTLVSEHAALIVLGLAAEALAPGGAPLATCSWKAAAKGRPPPCDGLRAPGLVDAPDAVAYWGPGAEPRGVGLPRHQAAVARKQPGGANRCPGNPEKRRRFPTLEASISVEFQSIRLLPGPLIISAQVLEIWAQPLLASTDIKSRGSEVEGISWTQA